MGAFSEFASRIKKGLCPICSEPIDEDSFRDELSRKEYGITGMCQVCQDNFFVDEE